MGDTNEKVVGHPVKCEWCKEEFLLMEDEIGDLPEEVNCPGCGSVLWVVLADTLKPETWYPDRRGLEEKWGIEAVRGDVAADERMWWDR